MGKTGNGKSTTGNTILDKTHFESSPSASSVTKECKSACEPRFGKYIQIVDTPGMLDTNMSEDEVKKEIGKCIGLSCPGPHCFLLILEITRFTADDEKCVRKFLEYFGIDAVPYFIVVFTKKDTLDLEGMSFETFIKETAPESLKKILNECNNRYIAFNNKDDDSNCNNQVQNLINMITTNATKFYTNENYENAEKKIRDREREIEKERKTQKEAETKAIIREVQNKYNQTITQLQNTINQREANTEKLLTNLENVHQKQIQNMTNEISKAKQNENDAQNTVSKIQKKLNEKKANEKTNYQEKLEKLKKKREDEIKRRLETLEKQANDLPNARAEARKEVEFGIGDWFLSFFSAIVKILIGLIFI